MTGPSEQQRSAIELHVLAVPGVRGLYPVTAIPGATKVDVTATGGTASCELRIAADHDVPALDLIRAVTDAVRRASGDVDVDVRIEVASID